MINESTLQWKPVDNYTLNEKGVHNNRDYYTLSYGARSIDLDDIHTDDNSFVVTGVRFRVVGAHLNLEARLSEFNFETGELINPKENSFWKSNDNTDVSGDRRLVNHYNQEHFHNMKSNEKFYFQTKNRT